MANYERPASILELRSHIDENINRFCDLKEQKNKLYLRYVPQDPDDYLNNYIDYANGAIEYMYLHNNYEFYEYLVHHTNEPHNWPIYVPAHLFNAPNDAVKSKWQTLTHNTLVTWHSFLIARDLFDEARPNNIKKIFICGPESIHNYKYFMGEQFSINDPPKAIYSAPNCPYARPFKAQLNIDQSLSSCLTTSELIDYYNDNDGSMQLFYDIVMNKPEIHFHDSGSLWKGRIMAEFIMHVAPLVHNMSYK